MGNTMLVSLGISIAMFVGSFLSFEFGMRHDKHMSLFTAVVAMLWVILLFAMGVTFLVITWKEFSSLQCEFT